MALPPATDRRAANADKRRKTLLERDIRSGFIDLDQGFCGLAAIPGRLIGSEKCRTRKQADPVAEVWVVVEV